MGAWLLAEVNLSTSPATVTPEELSSHGPILIGNLGEGQPCAGCHTGNYEVLLTTVQIRVQC